MFLGIVGRASSKCGYGFFLSIMVPRSFPTGEGCCQRNAAANSGFPSSGKNSNNGHRHCNVSEPHIERGHIKVHISCFTSALNLYISISFTELRSGRCSSTQSSEDLFCLLLTFPVRSIVSVTVTPLLFHYHSNGNVI